MTDRVNGLFVVLNKDIRTDDVEAITHAIAMLRGVLSVDKNVSEAVDHIAFVRVRRELEEKLMEVLRPEMAKIIEESRLR